MLPILSAFYHFSLLSSSIFSYTILPLHPSFFFFFNDTATTEIYTLSLHDALPISRAEAGRERRAEGRGYAETPSLYLPLVASRIVTNNLQVAFGAFAFGITAGVGTAVVLVFNGLFFGAVLGLFANYGLAGWLLTFVAGHGVLELTAIFIAGGAGLLVGRALIAPGDLTRRDALVVAGRHAIRLVGASACLLCLAATIEGFLSASDAPAGWKYAVSAATAVLLFLYLRSGRDYLRTHGGQA